MIGSKYSDPSRNEGGIKVEGGDHSALERSSWRFYRQFIQEKREEVVVVEFEVEETGFED